MKKLFLFFISLFIISVFSGIIVKAQVNTIGSKIIKVKKKNSIIDEATRNSALENQSYLTFPSNTPTKNTCDTTNLNSYKTTWTVVDYSVTATPQFSSGFVNGINTYADKAKANFFNNTGSNYILGCYIAFSKAYSTTPSKTITVNVYPNASGSPGTPIASKSFTMQKIMNDVNGNFFTEVIFDYPVPITSSYFIGVDMSNLNWATSHDTLSIQSNQSPQTTPSAVWEKQSDNLWYQYTNAASWNLSISLAIFPFVTDIPANANFTQSSTTICSGYPLTLNASSSIQNSVYWLLPGGNPANSSVVSPTVTYATAGTKNIKLYVLGGGCNNLDSMLSTVTVLPSPVVGVSSTPAAICLGNSASLNATGGIYYEWAGFPPGQNPVTVNPTANTTYNVTVTSGNGCSASQNVTVNVNQAPDPNANATPPSICLGSSSLLTSTPGMASYIWTPSGGTTAALSVTPGTTTTYTVATIDGNGCTAIDSVVVTVDPCTNINSTEANDNDISIFPNPTEGNFILDFKNLNFENAEIRGYNYEGKLVLLRSLKKQSGSTNINLSQFAKGIYYIRFIYDKSIITKRVVIY
ncbi:MAG: T9SS type A sorting domain-containing protein [Bacteroidetes bacterium]|nr:T9SS type A sorting domain-containing protein [Bacteroidota bacterium]